MIEKRKTKHHKLKSAQGMS